MQASFNLGFISWPVSMDGANQSQRQMTYVLMSLKTTTPVCLNKSCGGKQMERGDSVKPVVRHGEESRVPQETSLHSDIFLSKKQMETPSDKQLADIPSLWVSQLIGWREGRRCQITDRYTSPFKRRCPHFYWQVGDELRVGALAICHSLGKLLVGLKGSISCLPRWFNAMGKCKLC